MARVLDGQPSFERFLEELREIRYRDGRFDGYASRLHYFSEWIRDNQEKGVVQDITRELGGVPAAEPVNLMSSNRDAYDALQDLRDADRRANPDSPSSMVRSRRAGRSAKTSPVPKVAAEKPL